MSTRPISLAEAGAQSPQDIIGRDLEDLTATMERWFSARGIDGARVQTPAYPVGAGQSNETLLFTLSAPARQDQGVVLRIAPGGYQLFMDSRFDVQRALLRTLARGRHVRVPEILWEEADPTWLGQPFFMMSRLNGFVPVSNPPYNAAGRLFDAHPRERERLWQNALLEMTRIHTVPLDDVQFARRGDAGVSGLRDLLDFEIASYRWAAAGRDVPVMDEALAWLEANFPANPVDGLSWGDARIGNMMFDDAFNLLGVFDWEQASLAGPEMDLGWWLFFDTLYSRGIGLERLAGLGDRAATIAAWEGLTGRRVRDLAWHEYFAGFRLATIFLRKTILDRFSAPGANISNNFFTRLMADIRDIAPPPDIHETYS